ncbi:hypothetical protein BC938DRAFT_475308, partial [Jimgerdemannia flammicorona]
PIQNINFVYCSDVTAVPCRTKSSTTTSFNPPTPCPPSPNSSVPSLSGASPLRIFVALRTTATVMTTTTRPVGTSRAAICSTRSPQLRARNVSRRTGRTSTTGAWAAASSSPASCCTTSQIPVSSPGPPGKPKNPCRRRASRWITPRAIEMVGSGDYNKNIV